MCRKDIDAPMGEGSSREHTELQRFHLCFDRHKFVSLLIQDVSCGLFLIITYNTKSIHSIEKWDLSSSLLCFQNDLHDIFYHSCDPVELDQTYFNSLSWANDLVLISQSSEGLQSCLDKLNNYCDKWHLNVNVKKTKAMVMSKGNPKATTFYFSKNSLENFKAYKYLGLIISSNGSRTRMVNDRVLKAKTAAFAIKQAISTTQNISTKLFMSLFDKQIEPILLYGSPIWGIPSSTHSLKLKGDTLDTNTRVAAYKCLQFIGINDILTLYLADV